YFLLLRIVTFYDFIDGTSQIEVLFSDVVVFSFKDFPEAADSVCQLDVLSFDSRKLLRYVEVLGQEFLNTSGSIPRRFIFFRKFIQTKDRDHILEFLVSLQDLSDFIGNAVVFFTDDISFQSERVGVQRINRRVNTKGSQRTAQDDGCIQVGEGRRWSRISDVIGWDIHRLYGGDRSFLRCRNTFLQGRHVGCQRRLVPYRRRQASEER